MDGVSEKADKQERSLEGEATSRFEVLRRVLSGFAVADCGELFEEFLFFVGKILRELADEANVFVTAAFRLDARHAASRKPKQPIVLSTGRNRHRDFATERRNVHLSAEDEIVDADREIDVEIVAFALIGWIVLQLYD
jgi:hypothetical protein